MVDRVELALLKAGNVEVSLVENSDANADATERSQVEAFLATARERFKLVTEAESTLRAQQLEDLEFVASNQWPGDIEAERSVEGRPCLTINRLPQFIRQVTNQQRASRPAIQVNPKGGGATLKVAEILQDLVRDIELESDADVAYITGAESQVKMGRGFWRIVTEYSEDPESFDQVIRIRRIRNPFTVYMDPGIQRIDGSDARFCFIVEDLTKQEFVARFGDRATASLTEFVSIGDQAAAWLPNNGIRIAEYWYVVEEVETLLEIFVLPNPMIQGDAGYTFKAVDSAIDLESLPPHEIVNRRERTVRKVKYALINAVSILEGNETKTAGRDWPGKWIPIVPVIGEEIDLNGRVDYRGMVRDAREPQRAYNFWLPLALDTPIPTPSGWTTMGEIQPGDEVFTPKGQTCKVLGKSPVYEGRDCFKITFGDGSTIVADSDHVWQVEERLPWAKKVNGEQSYWATRKITTSELVPKKHAIWATKPLQLPEAELPIDPYVLGVWLSDGRADDSRISQKTSDVAALQDALAAHGAEFGRMCYGGPDAKCFGIKGLTAKLEAAGLIKNKHIPKAYLRASLMQRLALLQGLMDGDGSVSRKLRVCEFTTHSKAMRDGMSELLRSLGIRAKYDFRQPRTSTMKNGQTIIGRHPVYQFRFSAPPPEVMPVFAMPRKFASQKAINGIYHPRRTDRHRIVSVEPVPSVPVQCIGVDSPEHLFLVGDAMIPTHNSAATEAVALAPKAPWVMAYGQDEGLETMWDQANVKNYSRLIYKPVDAGGQLAPPPSRNTLEPAIVAITNLIRQADNDLKATMGFYDASLGNAGPESSGKAILARQKQGEIGNSNYLDNLGRAIRQTGRVIVDLIPKVLERPQIVRAIGHDDKPYMVQHAPGGQMPDGAEVSEDVRGVYDLTQGLYDVSISTGPSWQSKRQEAVAQMGELIKSNPALAQVIGDLWVGNMDSPWAQEAAERLRKAVPPNLLDGEDGQPVVPPQVQQQMQQMQEQMQQMQQALQEAKQAMDAKREQSQAQREIAQVQAQADVQRANIEAQSRQEVERIRAEAKEREVAMKAENDRILAEMKASHDRMLAAFEARQDMMVKRMEQAFAARNDEADQLRAAVATQAKADTPTEN